MVSNLAANFGEADIATSIAHCYHGEEGVRCKARHDVCRASSNGEPWNVQGAGVGGLDAITDVGALHVVGASLVRK